MDFEFTVIDRHGGRSGANQGGELRGGDGRLYMLKYDRRRYISLIVICAGRPQNARKIRGSRWVSL